MDNQPINPFLTAKRAAIVTASLRIADVLALRPDWTPAEAESFLKTHSHVIAGFMLEAGIVVIAELSKADTHGN